MTKNIIIFSLLVYSLSITWLAKPVLDALLYKNNTTVVDAGQSDEQWKFLKDYADLIQYADRQGYKLTAGELYRTMAQQRLYVKLGLSQTFNSKHLKRKAGDLNLFVNGKFCSSIHNDGCREAFEKLGYYWENLDNKNRWGGNWHSIKDYPHFERR